MVRRDVGVWAAGDIVLYEPVGVQRPQNTQHVQMRLGVENVVDDTLRRKHRSASNLEMHSHGDKRVPATHLEIKGVVGIRH